MSRAILISFLFLTCSCAKLGYEPTYSPAVEIDQLAVEEVYQELEPDSYGDVIAFAEGAPVGLLKLGNNDIRIVDSGRYAYLGRITVRHVPDKVFDFGVYPEDQQSLASWCNWQAPIRWVTLGLWKIFPTYYPCIVVEGNESDDREARIRRMITTLRKSAKAMGGNVVIVGYVGDETNVEQEYSYYGPYLNDLRAEGHIFVDRDRVGVAPSLVEEIN